MIWKLIAFLTRWPPNRERVGRWVLFALSLPLVLGWLFPVAMCALSFARWGDLRFAPTLVLTGVWKPKVSSTWGVSTTLLRSVMYLEGARDETLEADTRVERHEHVHVRQLEDASVSGLIIVALAFVIPSTWLWTLWFLAPLHLTVAWGTAWLRGWNPYRDSEPELSAYAQTNAMLVFNSNFQELREIERRAKVSD